MEGEARRRKNPDYHRGEGESEICERREKRKGTVNSVHAHSIPFL